MARRHVTDTPQYKKLMTCPHVTGARQSFEYTRIPEMTKRDLPELNRILSISCDISLDPADPSYSGEAMLLIANAISDLMIYAQTDRNLTA
jgi:hypothetical protein